MANTASYKGKTGPRGPQGEPGIQGPEAASVLSEDNTFTGVNEFNNEFVPLGSEGGLNNLVIGKNSVSPGNSNIVIGNNSGAALANDNCFIIGHNVGAIPFEPYTFAVLGQPLGGLSDLSPLLISGPDGFMAGGKREDTGAWAGIRIQEGDIVWSSSGKGGNIELATGGFIDARGGKRGGKDPDKTNVAIGRYTLRYHSSGTKNTGVGNGAFPQLENESTVENGLFDSNTALGSGAGAGFKSGTNCIFIGNQSGIANSTIQDNNVNGYMCIGSANYPFIAASSGVSPLPFVKDQNYGIEDLPGVATPADYIHYVGIGTQTPQASLHIEGQGDDTNKKLQISNQYGGGAPCPMITFTDNGNDHPGNIVYGRKNDIPYFGFDREVRLLSSFLSEGEGQHSFRAGSSAGENSQGVQAVAIGYEAGQISQSRNAVAVGFEAGQTSQGLAAVAIGDAAGFSNQKEGAVAIGIESGKTSQGKDSVAIGKRAGNADQHDNSIVISSSGAGTNTDAVGDIIIKSSTATLKVTSAGLSINGTAARSLDALADSIETAETKLVRQEALIQVLINKVEALQTELTKYVETPHVK